MNKGRRKIVMLDEAGLSKQSLQFGPAITGSIGINSSLPYNNVSGSIGNSSVDGTPFKGKEL